MDNSTLTFNISNNVFPSINLIQWSFASFSNGSLSSHPITPSSHYLFVNGSRFVQLVIVGVRFSDSGTYSVSVGNAAGLGTESVDFNVSGMRMSVSGMRMRI